MNLFSSYHGGGKSGGRGSAYNTSSLAYGSYSLTGSVFTQNNAVVGTSYKITNTGLFTNNYNVTQASGVLTMSIAGYYTLQWNLSVNCSISASTIYAGLSINNSALSVYGATSITNSDTVGYNIISGCFTRSFSSNDSVATTIKVSASSGTPNIIVRDISFCCVLNRST